MHVYEPICLCASCAKAYRNAGFDVVADFSNREKAACEYCKQPYGMAYHIWRDAIAASPRCPRCGKELIKTQTMTETFLTCSCGYENEPG